MSEKKKKSAPKKEVIAENNEEVKKIEVKEPVLVPPTEEKKNSPSTKIPDPEFKVQARLVDKAQNEAKAPTGEEILKAYLISNKGQKIIKQEKRGGNFVDKMTTEIYVPMSVIEKILKA